MALTIPQRNTEKHVAAEAAARSAQRRLAAAAISGVLFDMGDVLYDATVWRRWLVGLLRRFELRLDYQEFFRVWDRDYLRDVCTGRQTYCKAFKDFLAQTGLKRSQIEEIELACRARRRQLEHEGRPLPGVKAAVARLYENGFVLGVLSDSEFSGDELAEHLDGFGLGGFFATVVSSRDLGQIKPHPAGYLRALNNMGVPAECAAFVGHDAAELTGAKAVGMHTIAFNFDDRAEADVYLARFEELVEEVGKPHSVGKPLGLAAAG